MEKNCRFPSSLANSASLSSFVDIVVRVLSLAYVSFNRYVRLFSPSLQWVPWPPLAGALRFPTFIGTMRLYDCSPSIHDHLRSPLAAGTSPVGGDGELSWVPGESLLEACPELETPAAPYVLTLPAVRVQPSARITASASTTIRFRS